MFELLLILSIALIISSQYLPEKPTSEEKTKPKSKQNADSSKTKTGSKNRVRNNIQTKKQPCRILFSRAA